MVKDMYVFFETADHHPWYYRLLDQKIAHVLSYEKQDLGGYPVFIKAENLFKHVECGVLFGTEEDLLSRYKHCIKKIHIVKDVDPEGDFCNVILLNCVALVKKQLGINQPFVLTPKQLYRHLLRIGGKEI